MSEDAYSSHLLALLWFGSWTQFDDTSGFGGEDEGVPLGLLAGLAAVSAVIVAKRDPQAGRLLGCAMQVRVHLRVEVDDEGLRRLSHSVDGEQRVQHDLAHGAPLDQFARWRRCE